MTDVEKLLHWAFEHLPTHEAVAIKAVITQLQSELAAARARDVSWAEEVRVYKSECKQLQSAFEAARAGNDVIEGDNVALSAALRELLRLYDWRNVLADTAKDNPGIDQRKDLLTYGREKKAAWEVARNVLFTRPAQWIATDPNGYKIKIRPSEIKKPGTNEGPG